MQGPIVMHALLGCATKACLLKENLGKPVPHWQGIWEIQIQNAAPQPEGSRVYICQEPAPAGVSCSIYLWIFHAMANPLHPESHKYSLGKGWNIWVALIKLIHLLLLIIKCCTSVTKYLPWTMSLGDLGVYFTLCQTKLKKHLSLTGTPQLWSPGLYLHFHTDREPLPAPSQLSSFLHFFCDS